MIGSFDHDADEHLLDLLDHARRVELLIAEGRSHDVDDIGARPFSDPRRDGDTIH